MPNLFRKIYGLWMARPAGYYQKCMALLYEIFALLISAAYQPPRKYLLIEPAVTYISEHCRENIDCDELARLCGISRTYLNQLFIGKFGLSPCRYLIHQRIRCACDLLVTDTFPVREAAELCGYSDQAYFSRQFRQVVGMTPSEYLRQNRETEPSADTSLRKT